MKKNRKNEVAEIALGDMLPIGLTLVATGITIAYGLNVMQSTKSDMCMTGVIAGGTSGAYSSTLQDCVNASATTQVYPQARSAEMNATVNTIAGISKLPEKLPLIVTVIVAAIVIGILLRYLNVGGMGGSA